MRQTFRLRRLHLLGSDACIIWARMPASTLHKSAQQEAPDTCIFHVQEHNSRHARPKDARVNPLWRASKKMPASSTSYARGKIRAPPTTHAYKDARATSMHAAKTYARRPPPACAKDGRTNIDARKDARVAPCCPRRKDARVWAVTGVVTESSRLRSSSHVLPHDQEQREGRFRL